MRSSRIHTALILALVPIWAWCGVSLSSTRSIPGSVVLISVSGGDKGSVSFLGKELTLFRCDDGLFRCFAGIPISAKSGSYEVRCGSETTNLVVDAPERKEERIKIAGKEKIDEVKAKKQHQKMLKAIAKVSNKKLWSGKFRKPVPGDATTPFGIRRNVNGEANGDHKGVDLKGAQGCTVRSPANGVVLLSEETIASGKSIVLDHGQGLVSVYFHLNSMKVRAGQPVLKGQILGEVGSTGFSTGPHLHWGVYVFGTPVDPFAFVKKDFFFNKWKKPALSKNG